jgi:hypothetical protein
MDYGADAERVTLIPGDDHGGGAAERNTDAERGQEREGADHTNLPAKLDVINKLQGQFVLMLREMTAPGTASIRRRRSSPDRKAERPDSHLANFRGIVHVNGYPSLAAI